MKKNFYLILIPVIMILLSAFTFAFDSSSWPYTKVVSFNYTKEPVELYLDKEVLDAMNNDASDIRVVGNDEVPYVLQLTQPENYAKHAKIIDVSSTRKPYRDIDFNKEHMVDGRYDSSEGSAFEIDATVDKKSAWFIVDIGSNSITNSITIWSQNPQYTWTNIKIDGSYNNKDWQTVKDTAHYSFSAIRTVHYAPVDYRFIKFTFIHTQSLLISEIEIKGMSTGKIYFLPDNDQPHKIYYGNRQAIMSKYNTSALFYKLGLPKGTLSLQIKNAAFNADPDNDGIIYDNCPFIANPDQKDDDNDGLGNACDNCPSVSNIEQSDYDGDGLGSRCDNCPSDTNPDQKDENFNGVGDVCDDKDADRVRNNKDNCPDKYNPDQSDLDKDEIGDVCDAKDDRITENKLLLWTVIIATIVIVGFLAVNLLIKSEKKEKK
jgi:hypothetical protein